MSAPHPAPIYLDYNASTPCDPRVVEAMLPYLSETFANPSSRHHRAGQAAASAVEGARATIARSLGAASATEFVFTSGATEANNLALKGIVDALRGRGRHLVTQATEHPSVLAPLHQLAARGSELSVIGVDAAGRLCLSELEAALRRDTVLVSVMLANNETGTLQPVSEVVKLASERGIMVHCDAAQAVGKLDLQLHSLGVDLLTFSGHKLCGPKGVGALFVRRSQPPVRLEPLLHGGGQEGRLRSGTVNVPAVVGLALATEIAVGERDREARRVAGLRDRLESGIVDRLDGVSCNGSASHRLPGTSNLSFAGVDGNALLVALRDLAVSTGSACTSDHPEPSYVLLAMGVPRALAAASLRFGLGRFTTGEEVDRAIERVVEEVSRLRGMRRRRFRRG